MSGLETRNGEVNRSAKDYRMDAVFSAPNLNLQLRTYQHESPSQQQKTRSDHILSFSLNGRPAGSTACFVRDRRNNQPFRIGNITFIPGGVPIIGWGPGGLQRTLSCRINFGAFEMLSPFETELSDEQLSACGNIRSPAIGELLRRVAQEIASPGLSHDLMIDLLMRTAILDVVRNVGTEVRERTYESGGLSSTQIKRITEYIDQSLGKSPTVADLSRLCDISPGHLMRSFKQSTGKTIHAHVQEVRTTSAQAQLADRNKSIKQIAHALGFANSSSFAVAFKRACGQSPSEFRRKLRIL